MAMITLGPSATTPQPNFGSFITKVDTLALAGTPQQFSAQAIPDGAEASLRASMDNGLTSRVYIAYSSVAIASAGSRIQLERGATLSLKVNQASIVWFDGSSSGVKLELVTEA